MRFGNGRDGLNIDPEEIRCMTCSHLGRGIELPVPDKWIQACIFPGMRAKSTGNIKRI
jgi:hypothetical protein